MPRTKRYKNGEPSSSSQQLQATSSPESYMPPTSSRQSVSNNDQGWTVEIIKDIHAAEESKYRKKLKNEKEVWSLGQAERIVLPINDTTQQGTKDTGGLIGHFLGTLATDWRLLPVSYVSWKQIPRSYKDRCYAIVQARFSFNNAIGKDWIEKKLNKIWKDNRAERFKEHYKFELSREENIDKHPTFLPKEQWAAFVDYRLNREKLVTPHTGGSKSFVRKQNEMETQNGGNHVPRSALYDATHKIKDGSYITEEARVNSEKMAAIESQGTTSQLIGPQDAFGQVMGPEHSGRVRGLGLGPIPSQVSGSFTHGASSSSGSSGSRRNLDQIAELKDQLKSETEKRKKLESTVQSLGSCLHFLFKDVLPNVTPPPELAALLHPEEENLNDIRPSSSSSYAPAPPR